jgi:hypothetical protein
LLLFALKLHVQTLVPNIEPFENRIPLRQIIIEMANFLKKELSESMGSLLNLFYFYSWYIVPFIYAGVNLKAKFNPLPKWQKMQGSHTEIVVYEDENLSKNCKSFNSSKEILFNWQDFNLS